MNKNEKARYLYGMLAGFGAIALSILFFFVLDQFSVITQWIGNVINILAPFVYGAVFAYLLKPMCNTLENLFRRWFPNKNKQLAKGLAVACSLIAGILLVALLILLILPQLLDSILTLIKTMPGEIQDFLIWVEKHLEEYPELLNALYAAYDKISVELGSWVETSLVPSITAVMSNVGVQAIKLVNLVFDLFVAIIVTVYLLLARKRLARQARMVLYSVMKRSWADKVYEEVCYADKMFAGFIIGKLIDSAIIGVLCYICIVPFNVKNSLLIAVIIGVTNIIPFFGPFIGAVPTTLLILIDDPMQAVWFVLFILVLQQFDGNILGPKILGDNTGLSSIWVLFSILLFGGLWGFVGMIVAVPLFAVIYDIIKRLVIRGLHKNQCDDILTNYTNKYGAIEPPSQEKTE